jgi:hypothetical protein
VLKLSLPLTLEIEMHMYEKDKGVAEFGDKKWL